MPRALQQNERTTKWNKRMDNALLLGNILNSMLMPSLKGITMTKIAVTLCNAQGSRYAASDAFFSPLFSDLTQFQRKMACERMQAFMKQQLKQLLLPHALEKELSEYIVAATWQQFTWLDVHIHCFGLHRIPMLLYWTQQGVVDRRKTAEMLVKDDHLDLFVRYSVACTYCLVEDIRAIWEYLKENISGNDFLMEIQIRNLHLNPLVWFWSHSVTGKLNQYVIFVKNCVMNNLRNPNEYGFHIAVSSGNSVAARFFFDKLATQVKYLMIFRYAHVVFDEQNIASNIFPQPYYTTCDILTFFLEVMDQEQRSQLLYRNLSGFLKCFIDWPLQQFFLKIAGCLWDDLPTGEFGRILECIIHRIQIHDGCVESYEKLFINYWHQSPLSFKKSLCYADVIRYLRVLFRLSHQECLPLLPNHVQVGKYVPIYSKKVEVICESLIAKENMDLMRFFIFHCIPSEEKLRELREMFANCHLRCLSNTFVRMRAVNVIDGIFKEKGRGTKLWKCRR